MNSQPEATPTAEALWNDEPDFLDANDLERLTGTAASTWRYWAYLGSTGPNSFCIGRRRVWRKTTVLAWLEAQEAASA